jgi:hypothetical protein
MPYGVDKDIGGDSPENMKFMESCVADIKGVNKKTGKPYTKGEKIAICKAQLKKSSNASYTKVDEDIFEKIDNIRRFYIKQAIDQNLAKNEWEATIQYYRFLEKGG